MTTFSSNMAASVLNYETARNNSASVIYIAIAGMSEFTKAITFTHLNLRAFVILEIARSSKSVRKEVRK